MAALVCVRPTSGTFHRAAICETIGSRVNGTIKISAWWLLLPGAALLFYVTCIRETPYRSDIYIPDPPLQVALTDEPAWRHGEFTVHPLARFEMDALVLGAERYWVDRGADLSPVDLALGWKEMSQGTLLNQLEIGQSGRFFEVAWKEGVRVSEDTVFENSSNMHMIPSSDEIENALLSIDKNDVIHLEGFLVQVLGDDGSKWVSSLTRSDRGRGACELIWVTKINARPR